MLAKSVPQSNISYSGNATLFASNVPGFGTAGTGNVASDLPSPSGGMEASPKAIGGRRRLDIVTKSPGQTSSPTETPTYFNVMAQRSGLRVKMAVVEHQSAGLRPAHQKVGEIDEGTEGAGKGAFNTLSQISSKLSGNAEKDG